MKRQLSRLTAGVDEAGRGPLAGPVVVAAVILDPAKPIAGLDDSKRLSAARRELLFSLITENAIAWSVVEVSAEVIDALNILQATLWGMQQAVARLSPGPHRILIDGNRAPVLSGEVYTIVGGDRLEPAISAASILAKVSRDSTMRGMHALYPQYGFDQHKGYPTSSHLLLLEQFGPCAIHRRSFAPVRRLLQDSLL
ncbi:MAG: ribonuclease HII [Xanthomonadales bacterium]|nr:ribonuclease HII [Xanthomonadales bacterium]